MAIQPTITNVQNAWTYRVGAVACGGAIAGGAVVVALNDPAAEGSGYPTCIFQTATGLWCPGCGLTRGLHQLLNGRVGAAMSYNVFVPLLVVAVAWGWWSWMRTSWGRAPLRAPRLVGQAMWAVPVALVIYGVLRNIPTAPFNALAP